MEELTKNTLPKAKEVVKTGRNAASNTTPEGRKVLLDNIIENARKVQQQIHASRKGKSGKPKKTGFNGSKALKYWERVQTDAEAHFLPGEREKATRAHAADVRAQRLQAAHARMIEPRNRPVEINRGRPKKPKTPEEVEEGGDSDNEDDAIPGLPGNQGQVPTNVDQFYQEIKAKIAAQGYPVGVYRFQKDVPILKPNYNTATSTDIFQGDLVFVIPTSST